eukprot:scaffold359914_cov17-Prasinocladus_malaysianus.AAC.1
MGLILSCDLNCSGILSGVIRVDKTAAASDPPPRPETPLQKLMSGKLPATQTDHNTIVAMGEPS